MTRPVVLLIDRDEAQLQERAEVVRQAGCWVLPASTLAAALSLCLKIRPSLIIVAPSLVDADVHGLLAKIRPVPALAFVPVLVFSETERDAAPVLDDDWVRWISPPPSSHALAALLEQQQQDGGGR